MSTTPSDHARRRGTNAQMDVETLIEKAGWPRKYARKGQTMQFMTALESLFQSHPRRAGFRLDEIVREIRKNKRWFNPYIKWTGIGDQHSCNSGCGYKVKGRTVMNLPKKAQDEAITKVLKSNVINIKNMETSTRKTDNSVFVKKWCDEVYYERTGTFRFSGELAHLADN